MSKYSEFLKSVKESQLTKFFGEVKHTSNKYFKFNHVLVIDNNKVVYLKEWNVAEMQNDTEIALGWGK